MRRSTIGICFFFSEKKEKPQLLPQVKAELVVRQPREVPAVACSRFQVLGFAPRPAELSIPASVNYYQTCLRRVKQ